MHMQKQLSPKHVKKMIHQAVISVVREIVTDREYLLPLHSSTELRLKKSILSKKTGDYKFLKEIKE